MARSAQEKIQEELAIAQAREKVAQQVAQAIRDRQAAESKDVQIAEDVLITLPGGKRVLASTFLGHKYATINQTEQEFLAHPERFVKDPDPNMAYLLPDGDSVVTQSRIRGGRYIPVKMKEMDLSKCPPTHEGTDGNVHWYRHILVKVPKDIAEAMYRVPEQEAVRRLVGAIDKFRGDVEKESKGYAEGHFSHRVDKE